MSGITRFDREHMADIVADRLGREYDWFTAQLLRLIRKADPLNRGMLRLVYPEEVAALEQWERTGSAWPSAQRMSTWDELEAWAKSNDMSWAQVLDAVENAPFVVIDGEKSAADTDGDDRRATQGSGPAGGVQPD